MEKVLKVVFYILLAIFGGFIGLKIAYSIAYMNPMISENIRAFVGIGILLGFILTPVFVKLFLMFIDYVVKFLSKLSLQELVLSAIGLIFGLIIATLVNYILKFIPFEEIPIFGKYIYSFLTVVLAIFWCYLGILLTTKFSFIQGFSQLFGAKEVSFLTSNHKILDTSVIIDGRILDLCKTGFIEGVIVVPDFVLDELQEIADSDDAVRRAKGRRALELLNKLKKEIGFEIVKKSYPEQEVDSKLISLATDMKAALITLDYNLAKVAQIQGVKVLSINDLSLALKPIILPGEDINIKPVKEGKEQNQAVAYLEDGTMIVIEGGKKYIGENISAEVTSIIQTTAGKMIFAKPKN